MKKIFFFGKAKWQRLVDFQGIVLQNFVIYQNIAKKLTEKWALFARRKWTGIKKRTEPLVRLYRKTVSFWEKFKRICSMVWNKAKDFFQKKKNRTLSFLEDKQAKIRRLSKKQIHHLWIRRLPESWQYWFKKFLFHPTTQAICKNAVKLYCGIALWYLRISQYLLVMIEKFAQVVFKYVEQICNYIRIGKQKVKEFLDLGIEYGIFYFWKSCYYFLLGAIVIGILFLWGIRHSGSLMHVTKKSLVSFLRNRDILQ